MRPMILQFFEFAHLPAPMQATSRPFFQLAVELHESLPDCEERDVAFRKLLEAKDAAVRARLIAQKAAETERART